VKKKRENENLKVGNDLRRSDLRNEKWVTGASGSLRRPTNSWRQENTEGKEALSKKGPRDQSYLGYNAPERNSGTLGGLGGGEGNSKMRGSAGGFSRYLRVQLLSMRSFVLAWKNAEHSKKRGCSELGGKGSS